MADYITELNRREVQITRFASYLLKEYAYPSLSEAIKSVRAILLDAENIKSKTKLTTVEREIKKQLLNPLTSAMDEIEAEMRAFAISEAEFAAELLSEASGEAIRVPSADAVLALATKEYMTLETSSTAVSAPYAAFQKANVDNTLELVINQISAGFSKGETVKQLAARVSQVVNGLAKNQIDTLVRTGVAFYSQQSRNAMRDENLDVIEREYPIITFDNRTSFICMSISDKYMQGWKVGHSPIGYPPYHYNAVVAGELVKTESGNKPIELVAVGENVVTHKGRLRPVTAVMSKTCESGVARVIEFESGLTVTVTDEHPLLVSGHGWVRADEVKVGDNLFKNITEVSPLLAGLPVVECNPNDYPSIFDGEEVFSEVSVRSGSVAASINLDGDLAVNKGKVSNGIVVDVLSGESFDARCDEVSIKGLLSGHLGSEMPLPLAFHERIVSLFGFEGISIFHSLGVAGVYGAGMLCKPVSPVVNSNSDTIRYFYACCLLGCLTPAHGANAVNFTPSTHSTISKRKLSLYGSEGFSLGEVVVGEEFDKEISISKFNHWEFLVVKSITTVGYGGKVYNLEVEEDHTYLINDVVTHNCRTIIGYWTRDNIELEGTRAAVGGLDTKEAQEAAEKGELNRRNRKDKDYFDPRPIPANTPFSKFLKSQPRWYIKQQLGKQLAEDFISGKVNLSQLTDRNLKPLTLAQINERG